MTGKAFCCVGSSCMSLKGSQRRFPWCCYMHRTWVGLKASHTWSSPLGWGFSHTSLRDVGSEIFKRHRTNPHTVSHKQTDTLPPRLILFWQQTAQPNMKNAIMLAHRKLFWFSWKKLYRHVRKRKEEGQDACVLFIFSFISVEKVWQAPFKVTDQDSWDSSSSLYKRTGQLHINPTWADKPCCETAVLLWRAVDDWIQISRFTKTHYISEMNHGWKVAVWIKHELYWSR